jgi:L-amino acid N-acyltransferase YncA
MSTTASARIRDLQPDDWPAVAAIYAAGIATGNATFETRTPSWPDWDAGHLARPRLVAETGNRQITGWAALSAVSDRCAYTGVAEVSVYVAAHAQGAGVGSTLLAALVAGSEDAGIWTLQAGIFPENVASLALHTAAGFRIVGRRERLGRLHGVWRDVLQLERRSSVVGVAAGT